MMEAVMEANTETEAQKAARIRRVKARKALAVAPELAYQLRWDSTPLDGRTERGIEVFQERTPLLTGVTDSADYLYAHLYGWVAYWADQLELVAPVGWLWRRAVGDELLGFRADTSPETAHNLVTSTAAWLLWHELAINEHDTAPEYQDSVSYLVWSLRASAGLIQPRRGSHVKRSDIIVPASEVCPRCKADEVHAEYFGEPMAHAEARGERLRLRDMGDEIEPALNEFAQVLAGVTVKCAACGWSPELRPSKVARWLA